MLRILTVILRVSMFTQHTKISSRSKTYFPLGTPSVSNAADSRTTITAQQQQSESPFCPPELGVDLPGKLRQLGPYYDNYHTLISDIRILPTLFKILCDK